MTTMMTMNSSLFAENWFEECGVFCSRKLGLQSQAKHSREALHYYAICSKLGSRSPYYHIDQMF